MKYILNCKWALDCDYFQVGVDTDCQKHNYCFGKHCFEEQKIETIISVIRSVIRSAWSALNHSVSR